MAACSRVSSARCHPWTRSQVSRLFHATGDARQAFFLVPSPLSRRHGLIYLFRCSFPHADVWERMTSTLRAKCVYARARARVGVEQNVNVKRERSRSWIWAAVGDLAGRFGLSVAVGTVWNVRVFFPRARCLFRCAEGELTRLSVAPKIILPSWTWSRFDSDAPFSGKFFTDTTSGTSFVDSLAADVKATSGFRG